MQQRKVTNKIKNLAKTNKANRLPVVKSPKSLGISYLSLIALGINSINNNAAQLISSLIAAYNCHMMDSRIIELGQDIAFSALINGKWNDIVKLEKYLQTLTKKYQIHIHFKRSDTLTNAESLGINQYINYLVQATTINKLGILNKLLQFFHKENISVKEANIDVHNNNPNLINLTIQLKIPANNQILLLRERFLTYCDALNLDTSLEPAS